MNENDIVKTENNAKSDNNDSNDNINEKNDDLSDNGAKKEPKTEENKPDIVQTLMNSGTTNLQANILKFLS